MTDYDDLRSDMAAIADSLARYSQAVGHATGEHDLQIRKIWTDLAELRDDFYGLANRLEALTHFVTTSPAEVAEKMVNGRFVCPVDDCHNTHPHVHKPEGILYT